MGQSLESYKKGEEVVWMRDYDGLFSDGTKLGLDMSKPGGEMSLELDMSQGKITFKGKGGSSASEKSATLDVPSAPLRVVLTIDDPSDCWELIEPRAIAEPRTAAEPRAAAELLTIVRTWTQFHPSLT